MTEPFSTVLPTVPPPTPDAFHALSERLEKLEQDNKEQKRAHSVITSAFAARLAKLEGISADGLVPPVFTVERIASLERQAQELRQLLFAHSHPASTHHPKPPSLKKLALEMLAPPTGPVMLGTPQYRLSESQVEVIRQALKQLPDH